MVCKKCGAELNEERLNALAVLSLILMITGLLMCVLVKISGYVDYNTFFYIRTGIVYVFRTISDLIFLGGAILALISLYKEKNRMFFKWGITALALKALFAFSFLF